MIAESGSDTGREGVGGRSMSGREMTVEILMAVRRGEGGREKRK